LHLTVLHRTEGERTAMAESEREEPSEALVEIFETEQESEAMVVRSLLESAGIEVGSFSIDAPQDVLPGVGGVSVRVRPDQVAEARAILAEYQNKGLSEAETEA
jgi:Putative prokaryotic signal transducing protein